jgi:hypothetical protein
MCKDLQDLRAKISRRAHNVLFAESQTSGRDMQEILREVLDAWADKKIHAATVLMRISRGEGAVGESEGLAAASGGVDSLRGKTGSP